jgi:hypothetical protein
VTVADTWDEAACRARLAAADQPHDVIACRELGRHAVADLEAALAEVDRLRARLEEADGVIVAATSAITEQLHRAVALSRECDRLRARLEECRLIGVGESDFVKELLRLKAECGHWQRKWAEDREEADRLRAALRPFAALAARPEVRDWSGGCGLVVYGLGSPNLGDCRRAAAALGGRP